MASALCHMRRWQAWRGLLGIIDEGSAGVAACDNEQWAAADGEGAVSGVEGKGVRGGQPVVEGLVDEGMLDGCHPPYASVMYHVRTSLHTHVPRTYHREQARRTRIHVDRRRSQLGLRLPRLLTTNT